MVERKPNRFSVGSVSTCSLAHNGIDIQQYLESTWVLEFMNKVPAALRWIGNENKEQHSVTVHNVINGSIKYRLRKRHIGTHVEFSSLYYGYEMFHSWASNMYDQFWRVSSWRNVVCFARLQFGIEETKLTRPGWCSVADKGWYFDVQGGRERRTCARWLACAGGQWPWQSGDLA